MSTSVDKTLTKKRQRQDEIEIKNHNIKKLFLQHIENNTGKIFLFIVAIMLFVVAYGICLWLDAVPKIEDRWNNFCYIVTFVAGFVTRFFKLDKTFKGE